MEEKLKKLITYFTELSKKEIPVMINGKLKFITTEEHKKLFN